MNSTELDRRLAPLTEAGDFRARAKRLIVKAFTECLGKSYQPAFICGLRTVDKQLERFEKGRVLVGDNPLDYNHWVQIQWRLTITWTLPMDSPHCYGAAIDLALVNRQTREWLRKGHFAWNLLAKWVEAEGLVSGRRGSAHVELHNWRALAENGVLPLIG